MDFQQFKNDIDERLKEQTGCELLEFLYFPYNFGHGTLVYRIKGRNVRFSYDGRDSLLSCSRSNFHEKYPNCSWMAIFENDGLILNENLDKVLSTLISPK